MRIFTHFLLFCLLSMGIIYGLVSCDIVKGDVSPTTAELKNDTLQVDINSPGEINMLLNDKIGGKATINIGQPVHGSAVISENGKKLIYTPATDYVGLDSLTYQVCVGKKCQTAKVIFRISRNCQTEILNYSLFKNQERLLTILGAQTCNSATFRLLHAPKHGVATLNGDSFRYKPTADFVGQDSLTIYAGCQAPDQCYLVTYRFQVKDPADCQLKAVDDQSTIWENSKFLTWVPIRLNDDTCGTVTSTTITQAPAHGKAIVDEFRHLYYMPDKDYIGPDQLTYSICNPAGQCSAATVYFTVKKDLDFESCQGKVAANADKATIVKNNNLISNFVDIDVLSNDVLCNTIPGRIYLQITQQAMKGNAEVFLDNNNRLKFRYVTSVNGPATDTFRYKLCYASMNQHEQVCKEADVEIAIQ